MEKKLKQISRVFAVILAIIMVFTVVPTSVFASGKPYDGGYTDMGIVDGGMEEDECVGNHNYNDCAKDAKCKVCAAPNKTKKHTGGKATCTKKAVCTVCKKEYGKLKAHEYGATYVSKAATEKADGTISKKCKNCKKVAYATISKIKTVKLSKTTFTYTGRALETDVLVNGVALKEGTDYTAVYSKNKNAGKATVKITFKGKYSGSKTLTFKINPKKTAIKSLKAGKKAFTVKYSKQTSGSGYEIQYSTSKKFKGAKTVKISKNKTVSKTVKKLKAKKTYYVRVRTVKGSYKSDWTTAKKVKTK